jgi:hypothetical protein
LSDDVILRLSNLASYQPDRLWSLTNDESIVASDEGRHHQAKLYIFGQVQTEVQKTTFHALSAADVPGDYHYTRMLIFKPSVCPSG